MEGVVRKMKALVAASPQENTASRQQQQQQVTADRKGGGGSDAVTSCVYCIGMSVYTKAMLDQREPPHCKGIEVEVGAARERVDAFKRQAPAPRDDAFTFLGLGISVYSRAWMHEGKHLPLVKGIGVIAVEKDGSDVMKAIEDRKRVMREIERERRRARGDEPPDDDRDNRDDSDDDFDLVEELFGGDDEGVGGDALAERDPLSAVGKPRFPPLLPTFTLEDLMSKSVENAKYSANAMYTFWAKRLDGFGERYVESCKRIVTQMEKQAASVPQNCLWLVHQIEKTLTGKGGGDRKP
ncbi:hypothetical protein PybrP1_009099 [[Pythium] brassicae (nom. inval.)]|nr:hypothetical protein PybrP1_009099 [[Pythium] brassicae (nom. inval.)]